MADEKKWIYESPLGNFGIGARGINPWVGAGTAGGAAGFFGINVRPGFPAFVGGHDPRGNPTDPKTWNKNDPKGEGQADEGDAQDKASEAWFLGPDKDQVIPTDFFPVNSARLPDRRFKSQKSLSTPAGWPQFPRGFYGIVQTSSQDEHQSEQWYPADPRLVAVNYAGPATAGTPVADMGGPNSSLSLRRHAPLHSLVRVIRGPSGDRGMLKKNGAADFPRSWLARQIGPAGEWDVSGGLVCDIPTGKNGTIAKASRILAMESVTYGGPLDVGHFGDKHEIGRDADGNPIHSLHISTEALFKMRGGDGFQDGPIRFQRSYPSVTRLPYPVEAHIKWDAPTDQWRLHSWAPEYRPPGTITPNPDPDPKPEPDPKPDPYGGGGFHDPPGPRPPGQIVPGRQPDPGGEHIPGITISAPVITRGKSSDQVQRWGTASTQERMGSATTSRALPTAHGETDWRYHLEPSSEEIRQLDRSAPVTMRREAFGAQGGNPDEPYMDSPVNWQYTQDPKNSRYPGGSANGGEVILPPEVSLEDIDDGFAPDGLDLSATYLVAGPGACLAWGTPELATGGVKTGHSTCVESGDLVFYRHDSAGAAAETMRLKSDGTFEINSHAAITVSDASAAQAIGTTPEIVTGFTTDGENSNMLRDAAANTITVVRAGTYQVNFQCSFEGDNAVVYKIHLRVNGVVQDEGCHRYLGTGQDEGSCSFVALKSLAVGDVISVYVEANGANKDFMPIDMQLTAVRIL